MFHPQDETACLLLVTSYVLSLEERVAFLESKLHERGISVDAANEVDIPLQDSASARSPDLDALLSVDQNNLPPINVHGVGTRVTSAGAATDVTKYRMSAPDPTEQPSLSDLFLSGLAHRPCAAGKEMEGSTSEEYLPPDVLGELDNSRLVLPTRHAAQSLTKAYFRFANLSQPLLYEPHFRQSLSYLYSMPLTIDFNRTHCDKKAKLASFLVLEVFAVALLVLQKQDPSRIPTSLADRYHRTASAALASASLPATIEGVQALLLMSQYFYHHPTEWAVWKTVGAAIRLAVELGLHQEPPDGQLDFLTTDIRRRTFWVAYALDRNIAYALCTPTCLADGAIDTQFPSDIDDEYITADGPLVPPHSQTGPKCVNLHVLRFRRIQSEMQTVLFQRTPPGYVPIDLIQWRHQMHRQIQDWYNSVPRDSFSPDHQRKVVENFDLTYFRALLYLYHPSKNLPTQDDTSLAAVADSAAHMIKLYRRFFDERRLTIYWQAVDSLSAAGTALLHSYRASQQVRNQIGLGHLQMLIQTCSSVLGGMVEHFPMFRNKRDSFDATVSRFLTDLTTEVGDPPSQAKHGMGPLIFIRCMFRATVVAKTSQMSTETRAQAPYLTSMHNSMLSTRHPMLRH
ncbi:uncharacterized protein HMPREF1541_05423 [Cyphellophora europaea CBS 101466]|uniref:Xylanolytic transcriptional activator regulatory domain-containing protein n=1 Tax=Cyphellophora europaea (strain CBS 101466) TaxID=1220924 RepID=W2RSA7_CYPE1|nr:uncharacterized protein HMPREF1541_05423 [Cyphellophora europaea CBS 101466]ETN39200.1 hypothetical protein HMPREF1541_05423 [Cyphellophora europaea CBS 101466]